MKNISFYIAKRYLIAKKGSTAVTFITWLSVAAMSVAVMAMFVIISVFSGLEDINRDLIANFHADLTLKSKNGKTIKNLDQVEKTLASNKDIFEFSRVIEEKVYINYKGKGDIAYIRGVDANYTRVNPINESIFYGKYLNPENSNEVIMENGLNLRLSIPVDSLDEHATIFMPKPGKGLITKEEDIYNKADIYVSGVFQGKEQLDNFIIAPIELTEQLLNIPQNSAYQIVLKLKNPEAADLVKSQLLKQLGDKVDIKTKSEENAAFWKMINTEKMMVYLIFGLIIFITTFNLAGAIIILQLDKKAQAKSLISLGLPLSHLRQTYFYTGVLITITGIISGLLLGTIICYIQLYTGVFRANPKLPFPVNIKAINYFAVAGTAAFFGISVSYLFSKINKENINKN